MADTATMNTAALPRRRELEIDPLWLAVPGIVFLVLFLLVPTGQLLSASFLDRITGAPTIAAFARIWNGGPYLAILSTTFAVAFRTTLLCLVLGRNGIVAKLMASVGIAGGDHLLFNRATVVLAMTHTLLPLAVVTMLPVMNQIDRRL